MAERATIYLGKPITDVLKCLGEDYNENKSGRISTVCERYLMIVSDEIRRMDFSRAEWMAILDDPHRGGEEPVGDQRRYERSQDR